MTYIRKVIGIDDQGRPEYGGKPLMCCWSDCVELGHQEHRIETPDSQVPGLKLIYVFCCAQHRRYYLNSHKDLNNLPEQYRPTPGVLR